MTTNRDGVLVCADGRTIAVFNQQPAPWFVLARNLSYAERRVFWLVDDEGPLVWVERTLAQYDKWRGEQPFREPRDAEEAIRDLFGAGR